MLRPLITRFAVGVLLSYLFVIPTIPQANATPCVVGSSSSCPGVSAQAIKDVTGTNTNGVYWIYVNGVATQVYSIMDSAMDGGGWMLAMKGANTGNTFGYSSNYWTTNNNLNPTFTSPNSGSTNQDAKFDVFNYTQAAKVMALFPDATPGGAVPNSTYGFTWAEDMPTPSNTQSYSGRPTQADYTGKTLLELFTGGEEIFLRPADASTPYSALGNVFSGQSNVKFFGFNYVSTANNNRARFGFGWNENGGGDGNYPTANQDSNDVSGGIGLDRVGWSAGDYIGCCQNKTGVNRQMKFELYIKAFATAPGPVRNLSLSGASGGATLSWDVPSRLGGAPLESYTVESSLDGGATWSSTNVSPPTTSLTLTGLTNGTSYTFRITATNMNGTSVQNSINYIIGAPDRVLSAVLTPGDETLSARWSPPNFVGITPITDYLIEKSSDAGLSWSTVIHSPTTDTATTVSGLVNGYTYLLRISAVTSTGIGLAGISQGVIPAGIVIPAMDSFTATSDGFVSRVSNYDPRFCYSVATNKGAGSVSPLFPSGLTPYMEFKASDYNATTKVWRDSSGNGRHTDPSYVTGSLQAGISSANITGSRCAVPMVTGNTATSIRFGNPRFSNSNFTLFHVARYNGGSRGRIINGVGDNWLSGFYGGIAGVAHHDGWVTPVSSIGQENNWIVSTSYANNYRVNGVSRGSSGGANYMNEIGANVHGERSDFALAEVMIFDRQLTLAEINKVESYLGGQYGISAYTQSGAEQFTEGKLFVHHVMGGESVTATVAIDSNIPGFLNGSSSTTQTAIFSTPTKPLALSAIAGSSQQVQLSWSVPDNPGGPITSYTATRQTTGESCVATLGVTSCTITGLPDTLGRFTVTATNNQGTGPASDYLVAGTYKPIIDTSTVTAEGFTGSIRNYTTNSDGVALTWSGSVNASGTLVTSFPNYAITTVMGGEVATLTINAASGTSAVRTGTTTLAIQALRAPPSVPLGVSVLTDVGSATVSWIRPTIPGGPITSYTVTASPSGRTCTWTSGPLTCTFNGLTEILQNFTVTATNITGTGTPSSAAIGGLFTPEFGTPTLTAEGFSVPVTNYVSGLNWTATTTNTDAQIKIVLPLPDSYARYKASDFNNSTKTIPDSSGNGRSAATSSGNTYLTTTTAGSKGSTASFSVVQGDTGSRWDLKNPLFTNGNYTFITAARYAGGSRNRIFTSSTQNWLAGFWAGRSGVAYHEGWLGGQPDRFGDNWVISVDANQIYRGNGLLLESSGGNDQLPPMTINYNESSDYQFAEILIFDRKLSVEDMAKVEDYLSQTYGITLGRAVGNSAGQSALVTVSNVIGGTPVTINVATRNPNSAPVAVRGSSADFSATVLRARPTVTRSVATNPLDGGVQVSWVKPAIPGGIITSYTATATPSARSCRWTTGVLGCTITGLTNGVSESVTVVATNVTGTSDSGTAVNVLPQKMPLAPVMTGFVSTLSVTGSDLPGLIGNRYVGYHNNVANFFDSASKYLGTGTPVTSTEILNFTSGADSYSWLWNGYFKANVTGTWSFRVVSDDWSFVWLGATALSGYTNDNSIANSGKNGTFSMVAGNYYPIRIAYGEGGGADYMNFYFTPPSGTERTNGNGYFFQSEYISIQGVEVSFNAPASNGSENILDYTVTASNGVTATGTSSPIFVGPLSKNVPFTFTVRARNSAGFGAISGSSPEYTVLSAPDAPSGLVASVVPAGMNVSWLSAGGNITEYEIQKSSDAGSTWSAATTTIGSVTSTTIGGLTTGSTYLFKVRAKNIVGNSSFTQTSVGIFQTGKPSAPYGLSAIPSGTTISLGWSDTNTVGARVTTYSIQYSNNSGSTWKEFVHATSNSTSINITGLTVGNTYLLRVAAINSTGPSDYSSGISVVLGAPTTAPTSLSGRAGSGKVTLNWSAPALGTTNMSSTVLSGLLGVGTASSLPGNISAYARYQASDYNPLTKIWTDSSGNARNTSASRISGNPTLVTTVENSNGSTLSFKTVQGTTADAIRFDNPILGSGYTVFNVARYSGNSRGRILTSDYTNWLSGFWNGSSGIAYHNGWLTNQTSVHQNDWVISTDYASNYRSNGVLRGSGGDSALPPLVINNGENSDYQFAELIIFDSELNLSEIELVERYLANKYGISIGGASSQVSSNSVPLANNFAARADVIKNCSLNLSSAVGVAIGYQNGSCTVKFSSSTVSEFVVPTGVSAVNILVNGASAGRGGTDSRAGGYTGPAGRVEGTIAVAAGDVLKMAPGTAGQSGVGCVSNTGGGAGGTNALGYNGGRGGNTGPGGCSGGGSGGGAASVIQATLSSGNKTFIAGGAGGAAGGNNCDVITSAQNGQLFLNGSGQIYGSNGGFTNSGDGGGAGGGGGGAVGGAGGTMSAPCGEYLGAGGTAGSNSIDGVVTLVSSTINMATQANGFIQISYVPNIVQPDDYVIQYSSNDGSNWSTFSHAISNATSIEVTGLTGGATYIFRVAAKNSAGQSSYSVVSSPFTPTGGADVPKIIIPPLAGSSEEVTIEIPADAVPTTAGVTGSTIFQSNAGDGARIVKIEALTDSDRFTSPTTPITVHLPPSVSGSVSAYSTDGINWLPIPELNTLPMSKSQPIGYFRKPSGAIDIFTWTI